MENKTNLFSERELTLAEKLHSASIRILRRVRFVDEESGLSPARLSALSVLVYHGPQKMGRLARTEGVKPPTMTRLVQALERERLVTRIPDLNDKRITYIAATEKGVSLMNHARLRRVETLAGLLARLDADQRETMIASVDILTAVLQKNKEQKEG